MIEVEGAEQFTQLAKALKEAGNKELQKELSKGFTAATKPFIVAVRRAAGRLPTRGGLAARVAKTPMRTVKRPSGVSVRARSPYSIGLMDKGVTFHPVFGNRDVWVRQPVAPGFWSEPVKATETVVRAEATKAMDKVVAKVNKVP